MAEPAVRHVLLIMAMEQEAAPIIERHGLVQLKQPFIDGSPFVAWEGKVGIVRLNVVWVGHDKRFGTNNVATTAAAVSTYAAVMAFGRPDLVISAGTAGGFSARGAAVCDVFLSTKCIFHARRIPSDGGVLEEYGFGHFRSPPLMKLASAAGLKLGVVSTSDSLDCSETDMALLLGEGAVVKEMEAAAVAWVCQQLAIPFIALKSITDIIDGTEVTRGEFERNLHAAALALQSKFDKVLSLVGDTPLASWCSGDFAMPTPSQPAHLTPFRNAQADASNKQLRQGHGWKVSVAMASLGAVIASTVVVIGLRVRGR